MAVGANIHRIGICGIGQMGAAAAVVFKRGGYEVLLWGRNPRKLEAVTTTLRELEDWMARHVGPVLQEGGVIDPVNELHRIDDQADLVMDCIAEEMNQKVDLFQGLANARQRGAIFITTTSGLSITEIGRRSGCAELVAGTHFWNPPHLMPLVEVIRGEDTADSVIDQVCEVVESIGKIPVRVNRDVPGFIGNRMQFALLREAASIVEAGIATAEDVDAVVTNSFGRRLSVAGPFQVFDLAGWDTILAIVDQLFPDLESSGASPAMIKEMVAGGDLGVKSGKGFYEWDDDAVAAVRERVGKALATIGQLSQ